MKYYIYLFLLLLWLTACSSSSTGGPQTGIEADIIEVVARHHFANERYKEDRAFLSIKGIDPSHEFMNRLKDLETKVLPGSKHEMGKRPHLFEILSIQSESDSAVVDAQDYHDGFFSISYRFNLKLSNGKWIIEEAYRVEI